MRAVLIVLLLPLLAAAQTGTSITDPNAAPQGQVNQATGDTQANAQAAYRDAQSKCRKVKPAQKRQDCVRQAMREAQGLPRERVPGVEVRPASASPEASGPSR